MHKIKISLPVRYMEADNKFAWLPTRIRKVPISGFVSGVDPSVVAMEWTTGSTMPPPLAVLLGIKGAKMSSTQWILASCHHEINEKHVPDSTIA